MNRGQQQRRRRVGVQTREEETKYKVQGNCVQPCPMTDPWIRHGPSTKIARPRSVRNLIQPADGVRYTLR